MKLKMLFVGDIYSNTGPANVNKVLKKYSHSNDLFLLQKNIFMKILELIFKILICDVVIFSGISRLNSIGIAFSQFFGKKTGYLMHGSCKFENKVNAIENKRVEKIENETLEKIDVIICVSKLFMNWIKLEYPIYVNKISYVNNALDIEKIHLEQKNYDISRNKNLIMSSGGGAPLKNIKSICKAIERLNQEDYFDLKLIVLGNDGDDSEEIKSYDFVEFIPTVPSDEMILYFKKTNLYIQNSDFETFGLAPLEALLSGCNLLVSKNIGMLDVFDKYENSDVILDSYDCQEIAEKIKINLISSNNSRLLSHMDWRCINPYDLNANLKKIMNNFER